MSLSNFYAKHGKKALVLTVIILLVIVIVIVIVAGRLAPSEVSQAQKATDAAVRSAEVAVASADKAITKTYETARKKVVSDNVAIQEQVKNLSGDAVAAELISLLDEYRRERDGGD